MAEAAAATCGGIGSIGRRHRPQAAGGDSRSQPRQSPEIGLHRNRRTPTIRPVGLWLAAVFGPGRQGVVRGVGWLSRAGACAGRACIIVLALCVSAAGRCAAQDDSAVRRLVVFGDSQAQGVAVGLSRVLLGDSGYKVINRTHPGAAIVHGESEWLRPVQNFVDKEKAEIAVVMLGANDRLDMRDDKGVYLHFRTDTWRETYAERTDRILDALRGAGIKIVWCGNPIARSAVYSADMTYINDIYIEETAKYGAQYLPLWTVVADDKGQFTAYGPDRNGVNGRLRNDDGIHFTTAGYELIAEKIVSVLPSLQANGH